MYNDSLGSRDRDTLSKTLKKLKPSTQEFLLSTVKIMALP